MAPVEPAMWPALEDLFGRSGASNGCWCMYWILGADYHRRPRVQNKDQLRSSVMTGPPPGLLALDESGTAVGWCRLTPRRELPWLDSKRDLGQVDDLPVWSLPCFYVRRGFRGQGVMAALIDGAVDYARTAGAPALESYPIDTEAEGATRNIFPGTTSAFTRAGFRVVTRRAPTRPIMRRDLND
ncbi:GNAT family N-acetyltransferase [Jatrophihabitans sp.]|uniref:GNAT family N-acetyltransferase n=1 Tax=Jatrophihabitans sp. TaxID=1932789 RepID=UPI002EF0D10A